MLDRYEFCLVWCLVWSAGGSYCTVCDFTVCDDNFMIRLNYDKSVARRWMRLQEGTALAAVMATHSSLAVGKMEDADDSGNWLATNTGSGY